MPTLPDPTGRSSSAKRAAPLPSSDGKPTELPPDGPEETGPVEALALPPRAGSTGSHQHLDTPSDQIAERAPAPRPSVEADIAQFLAHPNGVPADNSDDAPTVITRGRSAGALNLPPQPPPGTVPAAVPGVVSGAGASEPPSIAGRRLGHFELIEAIGAGGMAAVLKARDTELGRVVALKILPPEAARDPESVSRFKQEARAAAALDHDNVARVYYCGEDQGLHFIAFEFVEGDNLRQMIERRGVLPASLCVRYMVQVAAGLNHAAERGVVHRDIKPSNILITPDGRAKIVDMGLARHLGSEAVNGGVTQSGVTLGTFDYISPEQALDPRRADVRSDIYSLGCTFYHALAGRPPVPDGTAARKLRAHQNDEPLDPRELNSAIPDELVVVLARMMAKDPARRYQTPIELIAHLKGLIERFHIGPDALANDSATRSVPAELRLLPEPPRLRPWWVLAVAGMAFGVVAFAIATSNPGPAPGVPGAYPSAKANGPDPAEKGPQLPPVSDPPRLPKQPDGPVTTVEQLARKLEEPATAKVVVVLGPGTFDLTKLERPVSFQGPAVELVGSTTGVTKVIACAKPERGANGSLALRAGTITVRNVWFDMTLDEDVSFAIGGVAKPVGLWLDEAAKVELTDCVFAATHPPLRNHETQSIAVTAPDPRAADGPTTKIDAVRCLFAPGASVGMVVPAGAQVGLTDCGFAPHVTDVQIHPGAADVTTVRLDRSTFMLDRGGCVVDKGASAGVKLTAVDCLFAPIDARPELRHTFAASAAYRRGVLVRVHGERLDGVQLVVPPGHTNGYYSVDPVGTPGATRTFDECKDLADDGRAELKQRPWAEERPFEVVSGTAEANPWRAFKLKVASDPAVFTRDERWGWVPQGATFYTPDTRVRRAYPDMPWPPDRPKVAAEIKPKVWWPGAKAEDLGPGQFAELRALLQTVRSGDEILIRAGEHQVYHEEIRAAMRPGEEMRLTFKPENGSRPVLVVRDDDERDQSLFKLKSGEVTFEGIHFRIKPKKEQTAAAVSVIGGKGVTFRNCVFTLIEEDDSKVAVVYLPDTDKAMATDTAPRPVPKIVFDHCLVRGKGRAVWVEVSRPLLLELTDTLTALDGPVICAEAGGKVSGGATSGAKLTRVTALAGGPVVEMHGKLGDPKGAGLVKLDVELDACLFVAVPGAGRPLVEVEGVDPADLKSVLTVQVKKANWYANFEARAALAVIRPGGDAMAKEWPRDDWVGYVGEPATPTTADQRFGTIDFAAPVTALKDLAAVKPADLIAKSADFPDASDTKPPRAGADPTALPPVPTEPKPE